jgi:hypothetical protein
MSRRRTKVGEKNVNKRKIKEMGKKLRIKKGRK